MWIISAIQVLGCSCMSAMFVAIAFISDEQFAEAAAKQSADPAAIDAVRKGGPMLALVFVILGVAPGVAYFVLAFFVRKRKRGAVTASMALAITQAIVFGVIFLSGVLQGITTANPVALTMNFLVFGTPLALLGATIYWLYRIQSPAAARPVEPRDPWDDDPR